MKHVPNQKHTSRLYKTYVNDRLRSEQRQIRTALSKVPKSSTKLGDIWPQNGQEKADLEKFPRQRSTAQSQGKGSRMGGAQNTKRMRRLTTGLRNITSELSG
jgi:hypothetical protein